ncbi:HSF-type DNA-binding-domain-containing protein [Fimicolochytrium jonesii]|uniref:HSF-type DNA-binding-domain-containing protein n=1 Tax=Fimicolochytrium jonesii TaxID=1396493 RepID=UPI0022FE9819|nr:HSF-type DNA-binding-domain-containing protein [Fimicolochytrium jonesii]KAI8826686.1 HSF-type DNA-binding-domain-containing protein [Fimicolochytrium jonesii]
MTPAGSKRSDPTTATNQAAFVSKLYSMLEDTNIERLIFWDIAGTNFIVGDLTEFSKTVLPQYFKHSNFASFVRQLNMYGFHKINDMYHGHSTEVWEFAHPEFRRGCQESLGNIKRRSSKLNQLQKAAQAAAFGTASSSSSSGSNGPKEDRVDVLTKKVMELEGKLAKLHESYNLLWSESVAGRDLQSKHHQVITNITSFLANTHSDDPRATRKRRLDADLLQSEVARIHPKSSTTNVTSTGLEVPTSHSDIANESEDDGSGFSESDDDATEHINSASTADHPQQDGAKSLGADDGEEDGDAEPSEESRSEWESEVEVETVVLKTEATAPPRPTKPAKRARREERI